MNTVNNRNNDKTLPKAFSQRTFLGRAANRFHAARLERAKEEVDRYRHILRD